MTLTRVWRWLFHLAAAVSLGLCVATCVLWIRSYWSPGNMTWWSARHNADHPPGPDRMGSARCDRGTFQAWLVTSVQPAKVDVQAGLNASVAMNNQRQRGEYLL